VELRCGREFPVAVTRDVRDVVSEQGIDDVHGPSLSEVGRNREE